MQTATVSFVLVERWDVWSGNSRPLERSHARLHISARALSHNQDFIENKPENFCFGEIKRYFGVDACHRQPPAGRWNPDLDSVGQEKSLSWRRTDRHRPTAFVPRAEMRPHRDNLVSRNSSLTVRKEQTKVLGSPSPRLEFQKQAASVFCSCRRMLGSMQAVRHASAHM